MGVLDIISIGLLCAFFFGALVFYSQIKDGSQENSKHTFENAKSEAKYIFYLIFGFFCVMAVGAMFFGD
jgi:hypothetical protein